MKKFIALSIILLFFISCGIPSIRDFSSAISFNNQYNYSYFTLSLNSGATNANYFTNGQINNSSPAVLLLYTITNQSTDYYSNSFISQFKSDYRGSNGVNGIPITIRDDSGIVEITKNNEKLFLYPLKEENIQYITHPRYTIENHVDYTFSTTPTKFAFSLSPLEDKNEFLVKMTINDNEDNSRYFYRYKNNLTFRENPDSNPDYRKDNDDKDEYVIHIFAAVNVTKSLASDFSNDYWTDLKNIANIEIKNN
ncbi:hypothetical protein [Bullifex sp.]|uniref:hypothetical protein n=1 Tax=Bullifex sp. TaxID=2815808 RepID=UPI002A7F4E2B|nr:hypothetical protein [Bullifex sp.]MDD5972311.1 hypothetical protein [Spirochaetales bacterium]MDY4066424.1 hypothetical protein [Bullifex sp.]